MKRKKIKEEPTDLMEIKNFLDYDKELWPAWGASNTVSGGGRRTKKNREDTAWKG